MDKIRKIFMILGIFIVIFSLSALLCTITDEALREELKQWEVYTHTNMAEFNSWSKSMLLITIIIMILLLVISEKIKKYL